LINHLFAVRAFLPEQIGDGRCAGLQTLRELLREEFDRLFIKLRLPRYVIAARDIETPSLRSSIEHLVREAGEAHGVPAESPTAAVALRGAFDPADLHEIGERLAGAPLASAMPWSALGRLLPNDPPGFAEYRTLLLETLDAFEPAESEEFIDALSAASTPRLDEALDAILISVHAMA
jgi:hypothetical protein